jgi:hypothetical protein
MALVATTLASACAALDKSIVVASATSIVAGSLIRVDAEDMKVTQSYVSGVTVPVLRGLNGTAMVAHPVTAKVIHGVAADWGSQDVQTDVPFPIANKSVAQIKSYSASGAIDLPSPGSNLFAVLNAVGSGVLAMTLAAPTKEMDLCELIIASQNGTGAHTVTIASGLNGASTGYTVFTYPAGPVALRLFALNSCWYTTTHPAFTGTVTLLVGGIA